MKSLTCCFTGHRDVPDEDYVRLYQLTYKETEKMIKRGIYIFYSGGALGYDTIAAKAVLALREQYPYVKLILALPYPNQDARWSKYNSDVLQDLMQRCDEYVFVSSHYFSGCMHVRNRYMVDRSDHCISYMTGHKGGTAYTVEYALKAGLEVINIVD